MQYTKPDPVALLTLWPYPAARRTSIARAGMFSSASSLGSMRFLSFPLP